MIGLTGSFGTGKSTVARLFKRKGVKLIDADRLAHEVFWKGGSIYPRVQSLFKEEKGNLSRSRIAKIVFLDTQKRRKLESLIHPYVFSRIQEELKSTRERVAVVEVPLLFESGFDRQCDKTIVVRSPVRKVLRRLSRRGYSKSEVEARWKAQMPLREKVRRADYQIDNSSSLEKTRRQIKRIWKDLEKGA